jgi:hypothetical protein
MRVAYRRTFPPPGSNDTIDPDQIEAGTQWSQVAVTPITKRPSGPSAR